MSEIVTGILNVEFEQEGDSKVSDEKNKQKAVLNP